MIKYNNDGLCFDDILLVPQYSEVKSRRTVDLSMKIDRYGSTLSLPVIASPMDTITESDMAKAMAYAGGLGIIHRYNSLADRAQQVHELFAEGLSVGAAVGATGPFLSEAEMLVLNGATVICIDTANGHGMQAIQAVQALRKELAGKAHIMAGNVSTVQGYIALSMAGADSIRVGIGGGSCCTTRLVSGHGLPTLASVLECSLARDMWFAQAAQTNDGGPIPARIIADGGIRHTGDMVKAFAAGADAVMVGSMLAGTDETPGKVNNDGTKNFRGMASEGAQQSRGSGVSTVEGIETTVGQRGPVSGILEAISLGLGSGCSYSGVNRLRDLQDAAQYITVSGASSAETEPHAQRSR